MQEATQASEQIADCEVRGKGKGGREEFSIFGTDRARAAGRMGLGGPPPCRIRKGAFARGKKGTTAGLSHSPGRVCVRACVHAQ